MADIARLRIDLTGSGVVGPSVMTFFHRAGGTGLPAAAKNYLTALVGLYPDDITAYVPNGGDLIDAATGILTGSWSSGLGGTVTGTQTTSFSLGNGVRVLWRTSGIVAGRRVRGATFHVPASGGAFDTTGLVTTATVAAVDTANGAFVTACGGDLVIWSRPTSTRSGSAHPILAGYTQRTPTSLRSRRT